MSVQVQYGVVTYPSIKAAASAVAKKTGEPVERAYIRLWKRLNANKPVKVWSKARTYNKHNKHNEQISIQ